MTLMVWEYIERVWTLTEVRYNVESCDIVADNIEYIADGYALALCLMPGYTV